MPKLWSDTIEEHRREVGDAILDTTAALVAKHGLRSVTMSRIAEETGIGRATLYKYYPDVEGILVAWHERHVAAHLERLASLRSGGGAPGERLRAVLESFGVICHERQRTELAALLHRGEHVSRGEQQLRELLQGLLVECVEAGDVRDDVAPGELATYCLHALTAAGSLPNRSAVRRLVEVTLDGMRASR
ncbi:TetR/AcrR family transcriptional regulator [Anaeromyxobacter oryzae]|uniref:TetR family transcriptional regulator n=1 Tax=Anaeromyxobacter oryzae TaxID=2918170 RepID=A0ABM7WPZ3_9BACT|nr:TetR/AcrR family transcriptional regulator [Anaeromyxobacter oryzae]BDG01542.1 TetR family transcriptional regulator [Anaeromyxobacter oryzae]